MMHIRLLQYDTAFYQSKFDYHKNVIYWANIAACVFCLCFVFIDQTAYGKFIPQLFFTRIAALLPLLVYILLFRFCKSYKVLAAASFSFVHLLEWSTIFSLYLMPEKSHINECLLLFVMLLFIVGFCAPVIYTVIAYIIFIGIILLSAAFFKYDFVYKMVSLDMIGISGGTVILYILQRNYHEHYAMTQRLSKMLKKDNLTDVYNRNITQDICDKKNGIMYEDVAEYAGVLMLDIDFFKKVNDTYSHDAGDAVLRIVAANIKSCVRRSDFIIRWGGEEFVVVLPHADFDKSVEVAEIIRQKIEKITSTVCPITVSVGVSFCKKNDDLYRIISEADAAMYKAKNTGRNKVVKYTPEYSMKFSSSIR